MFCEDDGACVADLESGVDVLDCYIRQVGSAKSIASRVNDVVELSVLGGKLEELNNVVLKRVDVCKIAGLGRYQLAGVSEVGRLDVLLETGEGAVQLGLVGTADDDLGAVLESGFGDAETHAGRATDDEDATALELVGVLESRHGEARAKTLFDELCCN